MVCELRLESALIVAVHVVFLAWSQHLQYSVGSFRLNMVSALTPCITLTTSILSLCLRFTVS